MRMIPFADGSFLSSWRALSLRGRLALIVGVVALCGLSAIGIERIMPRRFNGDGMTDTTCDPEVESILSKDSDGAAGPPIVWELPVGTPAPDFRLTEVRTGRLIGLNDFRERKPVVLVLSSFT